ncbi:MAG TPA: CoA transferase, partial [Alphaproteobacteria bacterium]|nr:CoA transferase [Alphaproteobacteria bacterium]
FSDPQVVAQEMAIDVEQPGRGTVRMVGFPVKLDKTPCEVRLPAPELGAHTREVLEAHGYSAAEIAEFEARGVVAGAARTTGGRSSNL